MSEIDELAAFMDGTLDASAFDHGAHVRVARRMLDGHDFLKAVWLYDQGLRKITDRLGVPEKRSVTKTLAFMSLIAEGKQRPSSQSLSAWYSDDRLDDPAGRNKFLMPDRSPSDDPV